MRALKEAPWTPAGTSSVLALRSGAANTEQLNGAMSV